MQTTLNAIRAHYPCVSGWQTLLDGLNKTAADNEPLRLSRILEVNGVEDTLWALRAVEGYAREMRLFAVWCARQVAHLIDDLIDDLRVTQTLDVATHYANGVGLASDMQRASDAAATVALDNFRFCHNPAANAAAAASAAARAADAADVYDGSKLLDTATRVAAYAAYAAYYAAAFAADALPKQTRSRQYRELRRVLTEIEAGRDPYPTC